MNLITRFKATLLSYKSINDLNKKFKLKKFYGKGKKSDKDSQTILFWSTGGMVVQSNLEGVLACALKLRGNKVKVILCNGVYKACAKLVDFPQVPFDEWGKYCRGCIKQNSAVFEKLGIEFIYISELVSDERTEYLRSRADEITFENYNDLCLHGIKLGSHLNSTINRHTRGGSYKGLEKILKEYAFTVLLNADASEEAIKRFHPTRVYMSHGIYADWGPALSVSLKKHIPVVSYICCYLTAHFFFGTAKKFDETFLTVSEKSWNGSKFRNLNEKQKSRLVNFLERRYKNNVNHDMKGILREYKGDINPIYERYGLDRLKPIWGIMTHINWDASSDYFPMIHSSFDEWLYETIEGIYDIREVQWLIKIHPSELNDNPETGCQKFIETNFPNLPAHIKILKMDDDISPLDFYNLLDGGITVMGTGGLELSLKGKPVILAGKAHYSHKGFTFDAKNKEHYKQLLHTAKNLESLNDDKLSLVWNYAYIYFIQKQIPLLPTIKEDLLIDFNLLDYLLPGKNKFMDFLCDRILDSEDFILPEELVELTHLTEKEQIRNFA